jgi:hypothetical protein
MQTDADPDEAKHAQSECLYVVPGNYEGISVTYLMAHFVQVGLRHIGSEKSRAFPSLSRHLVLYSPIPPLFLLPSG